VASSWPWRTSTISLIFVKVAQFARAFSGPSRSLGLGRSRPVSRGYQCGIGTRCVVLRRTTRRVTLTDTGTVILQQCQEPRTRLQEASGSEQAPEEARRHAEGFRSSLGSRQAVFGVISRLPDGPCADPDRSFSRISSSTDRGKHGRAIRLGRATRHSSVVATRPRQEEAFVRRSSSRNTRKGRKLPASPRT